MIAFGLVIHPGPGTLVTPVELVLATGMVGTTVVLSRWTWVRLRFLREGGVFIWA